MIRPRIQKRNDYNRSIESGVQNGRIHATITFSDDVTLEEAYDALAVLDRTKIIGKSVNEYIGNFSESDR